MTTSTYHPRTYLFLLFYRCNVQENQSSLVGLLLDSRRTACVRIPLFQPCEVPNFLLVHYKRRTHCKTLLGKVIQQKNPSSSLVAKQNKHNLTHFAHRNSKCIYWAKRKQKMSCFMTAFVTSCETYNIFSKIFYTKIILT